MQSKWNADENFRFGHAYEKALGHSLVLFFLPATIMFSDILRTKEAWDG